MDGENLTAKIAQPDLPKNVQVILHTTRENSQEDPHSIDNIDNIDVDELGHAGVDDDDSGTESAHEVKDLRGSLPEIVSRLQERAESKCWLIVQDF